MIDELAHCPTCKKEFPICQCPTINRGSFAKYVEGDVKREEIREHLVELLEQSIGDEPVNIADAIMWVLNEDDVVIKADRELPSYDSYYPHTTHIPKYDFARRSCWSKGQLQMLNAGYTAVEPLIKEEK